jgi:2-dehydro-3-deoxygluconokinase
MRRTKGEINRDMPLHDRSIVSIGECMVELARRDDDSFGLAFGGDTFNAAIYMARLGARVAYLTALGDDPYSSRIAAMATREGIDTGAISHVAGRMPGLYLIETEAGERTFWYWRDRSPARELLELPDAGASIARMVGAGCIYLSGITLSLYSDTGLERLEDAIRRARAAGALIVMDSNYRPRGWPDRPARPRRIFARFWSLADIALPTFDDEQALWDDPSPRHAAVRLAGLGVPEVCIKNGGDGALVHAEGTSRHIPCPEQITPVDTTAAGDSFNAAYLCCRMAGGTPDAAALAGHRLSAIVIRHRGAIAPKAATADFAL